MIGRDFGAAVAALDVGRLLSVAGMVALITGAAGYGAAHLSDRSARVAPLKCSIDTLPTKASERTVATLCGAPYTAQTHFENGIPVTMWVYDAGTFLWFRSGSLAFMSIDERHVPEQSEMSHSRSPLSLCE